ncbi:MAG: PEGA domain-containing protein [Bacteroidota bacterium]
MIRRFVILLLVPFALLAQTPDADSLSSYISFITEPAGAEVILDSTLVGRAPINNLPITAGLHRLSLGFPSFRDWNAMIRNEPIQVGLGESATFSYEFGATFNLVTVPSGVNVLYEGRSLGTTPLFYKSSVPLSKELVLQRDGYRTLELQPGSIRGFVAMKALDASVTASEMAFASSIEKSASPWVEYVTGAGIVVSGVAAAYFKHQATKNFDNYRATGNPSALDKTRRYDDYSAVSLVITQASFAFLTYLLLSSE